MRESSRGLRPGVDPDEMNSKRKVFIRTFGCQMNKLDSEIVLGLLLERGYEEATCQADADVILFNTCSVRKHAEERAFSHLSRALALKERKPGLIVGVIGCTAQKEGGRLFRAFPQLDLICGTSMFTKVPEVLRRIEERRSRFLLTKEEKLLNIRRPLAGRRHPFQAYVAIARGCDNFCTYCIVPYVRGREVSRPIEDVEREVRELVADGVREVTLLGQNVDSYGKGSGGKFNLARLLEVLNGIERLYRIRFVTSHPRDLSEEILDAMGKLDKVCEALHLPVQSGSNRILKAMNRGYTREEYLRKIELARKLIPGIALATDFIVGFPGETEDDFRESAEIMKRVRFRNSFVFKYSPRPPAAASRLKDDVPPEVKRRRNRELLAIQEEISRQDNARLVGRSLEVLVEGPTKSDPSRLTGRSRTDHIVVFDAPFDCIGKLAEVKITSATALTLFGKFRGTKTA